MDYSAVLGEIENKMGRAPRRIGWLRKAWRMDPPNWIGEDPDMQDLFAVQDVLLSEGRLAWGVIVQANNILFSTSGPGGSLSAPADALYSLDPASRERPHAMGPVAHGLFGFKEANAADPEARALGARLADEMSRKRGVPIPRSMSPDYPTLMTSIFVERRHLPGGKLVGGLLPLLTFPEATDLIMIAPFWFWPKAFIAREWSGR